MFDPEKVTRLNIWANPVGELYEDVESDGRFISTSDFDKLLELYRALSAKMSELHPNGLIDSEAAPHPH